MLPAISLSQLQYQYYFKTIYLIIKQVRVEIDIMADCWDCFSPLCIIWDFMVYPTTIHKVATKCQWSNHVLICLLTRTSIYSQL